MNTLLPIIEFHKRDIDVNSEIELNLLLELLFSKGLTWKSISSAILSLKPRFGFLVIRSESNNFRIMNHQDNLPIITVTMVKKNFWLWLFDWSISPKRSHRSQISHSFYFGVKSNSNSFGKKGVKSTPPLLFDFKRSESTTPLPTPFKIPISIFFKRIKPRMAFFKLVHRFLLYLVIND